MGLFDQTFCQCSRGSDAKPVRSASASSSIAVISGNEERRLSVTALYWAVTASGVVCAKIVEISALTGLERADPTFWVTLRAKWTRHLCHPALGRIALIAAFSPACADRKSTRLNSSH